MIINIACFGNVAETSHAQIRRRYAFPQRVFAQHRFFRRVNGALPFDALTSDFREDEAKR